MTMIRPPVIRTLDAPVLVPQPGIPWADTMLLNPTLIDEPGSRRLHMLFRATGPWPRARLPGKPLPYPIFLGYATSDDDGRTWQADFSRPCLAPALASEPDAIFVRARDGRNVVNHANGCIEDPRLFRLDGKLYLTTACRMFPPGPYWEHDEPTQCAPRWATAGRHDLGRAARENLTVTVLWEVNLARLAAGNYEAAFAYVTHLSDPERGDNRDVFLFPRKLRIDGRDRYTCLHRPFQPGAFGSEFADLRPSIFLALADSIEDLPTARAQHRLLAKPEFEWEANRIGASWVPLPLAEDAWLLPYHGKQDAIVGYTQSFIILRPGADGAPEVAHRCPDRLMAARQEWERAGRFQTPCVFTCGGLVRDRDLIMSYGAADAVAGVAWVDFQELVEHVRRSGADGRLRQSSFS
jgi:predicted GH43/DUF377 family glycosyl hydrolase